MSVENQNYIRLDASQSDVRQLTVFGFRTTLLPDRSVGDQLGGELLLDGDAIDLQFRIRQKMAKNVSAPFLIFR